MPVRRRVMVAAAAAALALAGCTPGEVAPSPTPSSAQGVAFADFAVPLRLEPPEEMPLEIEESTLLTWRVAGNDEDKIRVMVPTTVEPDGAAPSPPPADYHDYLTGLAPSGAVITGDRATTIDGLEARRFAITSERVIENGTGCWSAGEGGCFGLPPELILEMATVTVDGTPVVLWARTSATAPDADLVTAFDTMLATVRFE